MTRAVWSKAEGRETLVTMGEAVDEQGGAVSETAEGLVRRVHGRKVVAHRDALEALALFDELGWRPERGASENDAGTRFVRRAASGKPAPSFLRHFEERLKSELDVRGRSRGPLCPNDIGRPLDDRAQFSQFWMDWARHCFRAAGWRPAVCPPDVDPLNRAWYPPATEDTG